MEDDYRHIEEDEERVLYHAKKINEAIKIVLIHTRGGSVSLDALLNGLRVKPEDIHDEDGDMEEELDGIVDDELLENNVPPGEAMFRAYNQIKGYTAATIMLAETILAAEEHGFAFRFLTDEEAKAAQLQVEGFPSYIALREHKKDLQATPFLELEGKEVTETQAAVLEKIRKQIITQTPFAVFEKNYVDGMSGERNRERRENTKHYLCIVNDTKHPPYFQLMSRNRAIRIHEAYYFNPMMAEDELMVYEHFQSD
ncbi:hypothetical protein KY326_04360 [Candidatus Woesearchaeota archaeon]|nr:hypothetical protein [Candidatus Woesearchaeota archaeon]